MAKAVCAAIKATPACGGQRGVRWEKVARVIKDNRLHNVTGSQGIAGKHVTRDMTTPVFTAHGRSIFHLAATWRVAKQTRKEEFRFPEKQVT